jgi:hypothetical protein
LGGSHYKFREPRNAVPCERATRPNKNGICEPFLGGALAARTDATVQTV